MTRIELARLFLFVRELPENKGQRVEAIQRWGGGLVGQPWCAYFITMVLDLADGGKSLLARTGSCDVILQTARAQQWVVDAPEPGDLYLYVRGVTDAYHVGIVTAVDEGGFTGLSGNTSVDGMSANGDRVAERPLRLDAAKHVFVRVPAPA